MNLFNNKVLRAEESVGLIEIQRIENKFSIQFPKELLNLYSTCDGGWLDKHYFPYDGDFIGFNGFIPLDSTKDGSFDDTFDESKMDVKIFPENCVPFGIDGGGNFFCFYNTKDGRGIFFLDLDKQYEYPDDPSMYLLFLEDSLENFINKMVDQDSID